MASPHKLEKRDSHAYDDPDHLDFFGPRPPPGYAALRAAPSQILLPLAVSNKCGQAFRWRCNKVWEPRQEGSSTKAWDEQMEWSLCLSDRVVLLRQDEHRGFLYHKTLRPSSSSSVALDDKLMHEAAINAETERWLKDYLNLDVPLEALYAEWEAKDAVFARFATRFSGLRMLRQDPWECLCAFVCSSNNNIARIGQMVQNLCTHFSAPLLEHSYPCAPLSLDAKVENGASDHEDKQAEVEEGQVRIAFHPFPPPEALAKPGVEEKLRELGFGYRAKYLAKTAQMLCEKHSQKQEADGLNRVQQLPEHLDESHWLYGIKSEDDGNIAFGLHHKPPTPTLDGAAKNQEDAEESAPARKRSRRTSARSSRNSSTASTETATTNPSSLAATDLAGVEEKRLDSVRSYLQHLRTISYRLARQELMQFPGVGPKVADCILLMSLDQDSSIPVDRHVFQFAEKWYRLRTKKYEEIADYFRNLWGDYAGWAHSVLFTADLRSFANYNTAKKEEATENVNAGGFWGDETVEKVEGLGYPTPPLSQSLIKNEDDLQADHSPPSATISEKVPQSLGEPDAKVEQDLGGTLAERIKSRPKRKSRLSSTC